jgi:hypothetical protein
MPIVQLSGIIPESKTRLKYFIELNGISLELLSEQSVNELNVFIKLFVILYADDTVILTDTKEGVHLRL